YATIEVSGYRGDDVEGRFRRVEIHGKGINDGSQEGDEREDEDDGETSQAQATLAEHGPDRAKETPNLAPNPFRSELDPWRLDLRSGHEDRALRTRCQRRCLRK